MAPRQYYTRLRQHILTVALAKGTDLTLSPKATRIGFFAVLYALAVLIDVLVSKGVVTNAELTAAYAAADNDEQDEEPHPM